jgi:subtilase family serine protease
MGEVTYASGDTSQGSLTADNAMAVASLGDLPAGAIATLHLKVTAGTSGNLLEQSIATSDEEELTPADNSAQVSAAITAPPIPDLTGVWASPSVVFEQPGPAPSPCLVTGTFSVQNLGLSAARSSTVRFYLSSSPSVDSFATLLKSIKTGTVKGSGSKAIRLKVKTHAFSSGPHYLIAVVDATNVVGEANEQNNTIVAGPF